MCQTFPDERIESYWRPSSNSVNAAGKRTSKRVSGSIADSFYNKSSKLAKLTKKNVLDSIIPSDIQNIELHSAVGKTI